MGILEDRLKDCEKVNEINKKLAEDNRNLRKLLADKDDAKTKIAPNHQELLEQNQ